MTKTLVEQLRQGCDCSEQVCEMDTFSEQAADRIEELEAGLRHCLDNRSVECEIDSVMIYKLLNPATDDKTSTNVL